MAIIFRIYSSINRLQKLFPIVCIYWKCLWVFFVSSYGPCGISGDARPNSRWLGVKGRRSFWSSDIYVRGRLLRIDFTSTKTVAISFHESICSPVVIRSAPLVTLMRLSYIPPWWGLRGVINFQWILSKTAKSIKRFLPSINNFRNSISVPTNEPPLSEMMVSGQPWWEANRLSACQKPSAEAFSTLFKWTAVDVEDSSPCFIRFIPTVFQMERSKQIDAGFWKQARMNFNSIYCQIPH